MAFGADVSKFAANEARKLRQSVAHVEAQIFTLLVYGSPVDEGRFRGNWQITDGSPAGGVLERLYPVGSEQQMIDDGMAVLSALREGRVTFFTNNLPYAHRLEYDGWSDQAKQGIVRPIAARFQQIVDAANRGGGG